MVSCGFFSFFSPLSPALKLPAFVTTSYFGRWVKKKTETQLALLSEATEVASESIRAIRTVRAFGQEQRRGSLYSAKLDDVYQTAMRLAFGSATVFGGTNLLLNSCFLLILYKGTTLVSAGVLSIGDLTSFLIYSGYLGAAASGLMKSYTELTKGVGASTRVLDLIQEPSAIPVRPTSVSNEPFRGPIELKNVSFRYPDDPDAIILEDISLRVEEGETVALIGPSGSGKSTLLALLMGFYTPQNGSVMVGGKSLATEVEHYWWMNRVGFVSQDTMLFTGTLLENMRFAKADATEEQVWTACDLANCGEFIRRLPKGLHTLVGPGQDSTSLSGGQRQRVAIARSILHQPDVLFLDEPTSALDYKSEQLVRKGLDTAMRGKTAIVAAHRMATIQNADRIVIMKEGRICAVGSHEELMAMKKGSGYYKRLLRSMKQDGKKKKKTTKEVPEATIEEQSAAK